MRLLNVKRLHSGDEAMVAGEFLRQGSSNVETLTISVPEQFHGMLSDATEVMVPALLLPCMKTGEPFEIDGEVSARLLAQIPDIEAIYLSWYSALRPVEVIATARQVTRDRAPGTGAFFSAGADSFHTLHEAVRGNIRGIDRPSHLLFVRSTAGNESRGFGQPLALGEANDSSNLEQEMDEIARATETSLVRIDTNIQGLFPDFNWSLYHHGGGLASISLALSRGLGTQLISSGWSYRDLHPWGSHPSTDPLWSTEYLTFIHYGNHVSRAEKIAEVIAEDELALRHLRVCNLNSSITNCGRCYKCLRTMIPLDMVGKLGDAKTLPSAVPTDLSAAFESDDGSLDDEPLYRLARKLGRDDYTKRIEELINKRNRRRAVQQFMEASPVLQPLVAPVRRVRRALRRP